MTCRLSRKRSSVLAEAVELTTGQLTTGQLTTGQLTTGELATGDRAAGDDELVRISTVRRRNLFWGCRLDEEAIAAGRTVSSATHFSLGA